MTDTLPYRPPHPRLSGENLRGRDGHPYHPHPDLLAAANAALELQLPLLLTGEAGCGKTDFAFAAASGLRNHPDADAKTPELLECYVRSHSQARDLLYHYDAIRRFGDAQHGGEAGRLRAEDPHPYLRLRPLGRALMSPQLRVVLIDEIDKAPRDLPNDLLRELDQGHFEIPEIPADGDAEPPTVNPDDPSTFRNTMRRPNREQRPLVIITSNVERQLPDPFLRRTVFFHIPFPDPPALRQILFSRFEKVVEETGELFLDRVVDVFQALRAVPSLTKKPATSELIHWLQALTGLYDPAAVYRTLNTFAGGVLPTARAAARSWSELPWKTLPALGCLVKLREDTDRLYGRP